MPAPFHWNDLAIHYERLGSGPTVLLLHAMGVSGTYWRKVIDALSGGYEFLVPDLPFHGRTGDLPDPGSHSHDDNAAMLSALVRALVGSPVLLVGHSYGGASGVTLALRFPDLVTRVVLIEPSLPTVLLEGGTPELAAVQIEMNQVFERHVDAGDPEEAWRQYMAVQGAPIPWDCLAPEKRRQLLATTTQAYAVGRASMGNRLKLADLAAFHPATRMLVGSETPLRFRTTAELVSAHIPGCALDVISGAGHMSPGSHPGEIATAIDAHFTKIND